MPQTDHRSIAALLGELRDETLTLFKQEVALAKTELSEKASHLGRNLAYLAVGGLVAYAGAMLALYALGLLAAWGIEAAGADPDIAGWLGFGLVGLIVGILGWTLIQKARRTLSQEHLVPEKTIQSLQEDKQWMQQKLQRT